MSSLDHFDPSEDLRYRHDLMVELYRVELAHAQATSAASQAELERLQRQQDLILAALAGLAA